MLKYVFRRICIAIPVLFIIATLTFFLVRVAPGGPFSGEKTISPVVLKNLNKYYGLDKPLYKQYLDYLWELMHGNLGPSFKYPNRTVNQLIADTFPVSLKLGVLAMIFALFTGLTAGIFAATKPNSFRDFGFMSVAMTGICIPSFVLGPVLIWIFALKLDWFNVAGLNGPMDYVLPVITLGALYAANIARLSRGGLLEVLSMDFIRTARAKGIKERWVIIRHSLRGGLLAVVSYIGPAIAGVITGSFAVETIFQIAGLGRIFVMAAFNRDYTVIMGTVIFYAVLIVMLNLVVDIIQIFLDPRRSFTN